MASFMHQSPCVETFMLERGSGHADATATYSVDRQRASERAIAGYCRKRTTQEVIDEISSAARIT